MKGLCVLVVLIQVFRVFSKDIPPFVHLCKRHDPELAKCFMNTMNELRPYLKQGIPEMDLPPGDPLHYYDTTANTGKGTSVTLEAKAWNQTATGLMDYDIKDISLDIEKARCEAVIEFPRIRMQGEYMFKGKVMLFEIDTNGRFDINSTAIVAKAEWIGKLINKKGKEHIDFEKINLKLKIQKAVVYFTNLINGNEVLTNTLNQAVNENMDFILEELLPVVEDTLGGISRRYFNQVFQTYPLHQLFPEN